MNTTTPPEPIPLHPSDLQIAPLTSLPGDEETRRSRSKIAQLPPEIREKLNRLMDEGFEYGEIITQLGDPAKELTKCNLSHWFKSGFRDWLKNQRWLEDTRTSLDFAFNVIKQNEGATVHQANLHIAANQLIQNLIDNGQKLIDEEPRTYVSLVNSVTRLAREAVNFQRYREACAAARVELAKLKDVNRKLTQDETLAIVNHVDEILGFK